jgi:hypothetical protein
MSWHKGVFTINLCGTQTLGSILYHHQVDLQEAGMTRIGHICLWWGQMVGAGATGTDAADGQEGLASQDYKSEAAVFQAALDDVNNAIGRFLRIAYSDR